MVTLYVWMAFLMEFLLIFEIVFKFFSEKRFECGEDMHQYHKLQYVVVIFLFGCCNV
jgi:hypothetical protein